MGPDLLGSLPTDNLYKFIALGGLLLVGVSLVLRWVVLERLQEKLHSWDVEFAVEEQRLLIIGEGLSRLESLDEPTPQEVTQLGKKFNTRRIRVAKLGAQRKVHREVGERTRFLTRMAIVIAVIGGILSAIGFSLWYTQLQRYQDDAVRESITATDHNPSLAARTNSMTK